MVSLGLRRLYVSGHNWLQPATRFSVNRTRHATSQWRVLASHANFGTMEDFEDTLPKVASAPAPSPIPAASVKLDSTLSSPLPDVLGSDGTTDWSKSYSGLSTQAFPKEIASVLMAPLNPIDVEIKPGKHFQKVSLSLCELIMQFRWFNIPS